MNMRKLTSLILMAVTMTVTAADYDLDKPFGFCTRASRTDAASTYTVTGGGCYTYPIPSDFKGTVTVLKSDGQDMRMAIEQAVKQYDVVVLDGSAGDFIVSSSVDITASGKTLMGINGARLCTQWSITPEIRDALNRAGVPSMSTSGGTGGTLSNGHRVGEEAELKTRQMIIDMTGDAKENYRNAGVLNMFRCQNVIVRNLRFQGPGSIDVGGSDLLSLRASKNCWVDHCDFVDGMDGNFDITNSADFNTVSWCTFSYTDRSYMHQNTNLIGSSDREPRGFLSTTFAFCWWGTGCVQRMPMGRIGKIHMLCNYFSSAQASNCINPRVSSEVLIEGNYFERGVRHYYSQRDAEAVTWTKDNYIAEARQLPPSVGAVVTVPYDYRVAPFRKVPQLVRQKAGATLFGNKNH